MKTSFGCKLTIQTTQSGEHGHKCQLHMTGMMTPVLSVTLRARRYMKIMVFWQFFSAGLEVQ